MMLILCEDGDLAAGWAAGQLRLRGMRAEVVTSSMLGDATRWCHRVDSASATVEIVLEDGRRLASDMPAPILNRLSVVPLRALRAAAGRDYGYAVQEMFAFYLSWLHAWPATVINRPVPMGLSGPYRHPSAWLAMAAEAGLEPLPWSQSSDRPPQLAWEPARAGEATAFVVAGRPILPPALPATLARPLARFAERAGPELVGVDFARGGPLGWAMVGASPLPNLITGGEPLIDALAEALVE